MEGKRQLEKRAFSKRLSLDSSLVEYMDSNKCIEHLLTQLREQHLSLWREKLAVARLQREVAQRTSEEAMHDKLLHELEEERHLRLQSERRLWEVTLEWESSRIQMRGLQQHFSRMEETVRHLLQSQGSPEQQREDTTNMLVYEERLSEEERCQLEVLGGLHAAAEEDSRSEDSSVDEGGGETGLLLQRLKALEAENSALALENANQREQYERCLDEVANQVVQALLTQKDLREECAKLKTRVFDLEQQNRTLNLLFQQQRIRPTPDLLQEFQQNSKSGTPTWKCPGSGVVVPRHPGPRNSCSSSELSLTSSCSEYSSSSSCTRRHGEHFGKRPSQIWDERPSADSSLPSSFANPVDDRPPTRVRESHILEGLRRLQRRKTRLEPPAAITKWGYKDCMNSNEGIYSPGIKGHSLQETPPFDPAGPGSPCREPQRTFIYDTDSQEDGEDDHPSSAWQPAVPSQGCGLHAGQLTHSISDSLFIWEPHGKLLWEGASSVYSRERPERLTHCGSHCLLKKQRGRRVHVPREHRDRDPRGHGGHDHVVLDIQLSDTDDNEALDELHIDSSEDRSPSDLSLTADPNGSTDNMDVLLGFRKSECASCDEEEGVRPTHIESGSQTFGFIMQQRRVKRTSSQEHMRMLFDAENGKSMEFSSHQTGVIAMTRDEIAISTADHAEHITQGITRLQPGVTARDSPFLQRPREETQENTPPHEEDGGPSACLTAVGTRNVPQPKLTKPVQGATFRDTSRSLASMGNCQKLSMTKIPSRSLSSPQKSKLMEPGAASPVPSSSPMSLSKSPAVPPGKLPQKCMKVDGSGPLCDVRPDPHIPKHPAQVPHTPKASSGKDWAQCPNSQTSRMQSRSLVGSGDSGDHRKRDKLCRSGPEVGVRSPSPPPPPGRSASLLVRSNYDAPLSPSAAKPETRVPKDRGQTVFRSPPLKASSAPVISPSQATSEVQRKKPSIAFKKAACSPALITTEFVTDPRSPQPAPSSSLATVPPQVSPKRSIPQTSSHQTPGTTQVDPGLLTPKTCPPAHELLDRASSNSPSLGRKGPLSSSSPESYSKTFSGPIESPSPQVNGLSASLSPSNRSQSTPQGCPNPPEKGLKTRLPVGLRVLMKSPQMLRRSPVVPGKQEKDSFNEASRSSGAGSKSKSEDAASLGTAVDQRNASVQSLQAPESLRTGLPETSESALPRAGGRDGMEKRQVERSFSSSKPHLKPALGMNGAKARSQSFSAHSGDKTSTSPAEGPGKIRTQIITNTTERGNSLTRQTGSANGSPSKTPPTSTSDSLLAAEKSLGSSLSRQESLGSAESSPSHLPLRIPPGSEGLPTPLRIEDQQMYPQGGCPNLNAPQEASSDHCRYSPTPTDCVPPLTAPGRVQQSSNLEASRSSKSETSGRHPDASAPSTDAVGPEVPLSPSIEEKVMLGIQENMEKDQLQVKSASSEAKPKAGPSFASWFGFRRSRLPALSSRKTDACKAKAEKKETKVLAFGNKQPKPERKKERKKLELQYKIEGELNMDIQSPDNPSHGLSSNHHPRASHDMYSQRKFEPRTRPSPAVCSVKDDFMEELLNRVDKKGAGPTESGSNSASCRSVSKATSQGSCLASSSVSTQGNPRKHKSQTEMETAEDALVKEVNEDPREDEDDAITDSAFQNHSLESNCQMRTLDSGIGTFPLPDSGNRSSGRYTCQPDPPDDPEALLSLQPALSTGSSARAQTLEREVPSSTDSPHDSEPTIVHSLSDPGMTARGTPAPQSRLPKPVSSVGSCEASLLARTNRPKCTQTFLN